MKKKKVKKDMIKKKQIKKNNKNDDYNYMSDYFNIVINNNKKLNIYLMKAILKL